MEQNEHFVMSLNIGDDHQQQPIQKTLCGSLSKDVKTGLKAIDLLNEKQQTLNRSISLKKRSAVKKYFLDYFTRKNVIIRITFKQIKVSRPNKIFSFADSLIFK